MKIIITRAVQAICFEATRTRKQCGIVAVWTESHVSLTANWGSWDEGTYCSREFTLRWKRQTSLPRFSFTRYGG